MGGPLTQATVCEDATLACPWHGYRFSLESGRLVDNPNERIMADLRRRAPACFKPETAPKYALTPLAYSPVGDHAYVNRKRGGACSTASRGRTSLTARTPAPSPAILPP